MFDQRGTGGAGAGDDVDHARGQTSLGRQAEAKSNADSGVVSAGFSTTVLPAASAGAIFQASIINGKFQGITWPATPRGSGFKPGEGVLELVRPAGVIEEVGRHQRQVDIAGFLDRLAAVHRLEHRQLAGPFLDHAGDPEQVLGPFLPRNRAPTVVEGCPGRFHRPVDVGARWPRRPRPAAPRWRG